MPQLSLTSSRKRLGQVFTPRPVADWMARWVCERQPRRILDPALGQGVFVEAIESELRQANGIALPRIDVFEIDERMLKAFRKKSHVVETRCRHRDFITTRINAAYDGVIANPPYVRHHEIDYDEEVIRGFDRLTGERLSRMTNLYGLFLIKIWTLLAPGGRAAVITPAEWLNADFGRAIKAYLLRQNAIEAILHFDHDAQVFNDALTTAAITLLRRGRPDHAPLVMKAIRDVHSLKTTDLNGGRRFKPNELDSTRKWTPLFLHRNDSYVPGGPTLGDVARCTRGIATGANQYFTLCESVRGRYELDHRDLSLCITKAQHVKDKTLTKVCVQQLIEMNERIYLLNPRRRLTAAVKRYLEEGERLGIHRRYLPSHRPVWYRPEQRMAAPIWVSVFARGEFRFVLNRAGVLNLTTFHAIYLREPNRHRVRALFEYLTRREVQDALRHHQRIYADGLMKLEPKDVESLPIPIELYRLCHIGTAL